MVFQQFNILALPYCARKHVLQYMGFIELYNLSCCSKICKRAIKAEFKTGRQKVGIFVKEQVDFVILIGATEVLCQFSSVMSNTFTKNQLRSRFPGGEPVLSTFSKNAFLGAQALYQELKDLFSLHIEFVRVNLEKLRQNNREVVNWANLIRPDFVTFEGTWNNFQEYIWMMENAKPKNSLFDRMNLMGGGFHPEPVLIGIGLDCVFIENGFWMQLNHLEAMENPKIILRNSSLTSKEVNLYVKNLKNGKHPHLFQLLIQSKSHNFNMDVIMDGINFGGDDEWRYFYLDNGSTCGVMKNLEHNVIHINVWRK